MNDSTEKSGTTTATQRRLRRQRFGVVESDVRDKTIKVRIDRMEKHAKYGKYLKRDTIFHVHDEKNEAKIGDVVEIAECRPISKTKSWRLVRIVRSRPVISG
jgi:small subunit ribosomal protein S17